MVLPDWLIPLCVICCTVILLLAAFRVIHLG